MLDQQTKKIIKDARDTLVGKVAMPTDQVQQVTLALIYKFMSDADQSSEEAGGNRLYFDGEAREYAWSNLMNMKHPADEVDRLYRAGLEHIGTRTDIPPQFQTIYKDAYIPYSDPPTLRDFLRIVDRFQTDDTEVIGASFEHMLQEMGSQGNAGQFRTPRHIIDFIVSIINPQKHEVILDPACGTAGFLISAYQHIKGQHTDPDGRSTLTAQDRQTLGEQIIGYDISPDMVKLATINMFLHHRQSPKITAYDTLTSTASGYF